VARVRMGDALAALGREMGLTNADIDSMEQARDKTPAAPMIFE
jgi:plasmid stability protein